MPKPLPKVPVTARALMQRINRVLAKRDEKLCRSRTVSANLGDFYLIDSRVNGVVAHDVSLGQLGKKLEVLKPYEALVDDDA